MAPPFSDTELTSGRFLLHGAVRGDETKCELQARVGYEVSGCRLLAPLADKVRQCLSGRPLTVFGTSVQRYQYMSLAYLVEHGEFPPRCTSAHFSSEAIPLEHGSPARMDAQRHLHNREVMRNLSLAPSVVKEYEWGDDGPRGEENWGRFFNGTREAYRSRMRCDCSDAFKVPFRDAGVLKGRTPDGRLPPQNYCGRRPEHMFYRSRNKEAALKAMSADHRDFIVLNFIVSDCGMACGRWAARCGDCWRGSGLHAHSQEWVLLNVGLHSTGAQSACYHAIASAASNYLRRDGGGRGVWVTTNWPDMGMLPATGGRLRNMTAMGLHENEVAASGATNGTGWGVFDLGALDQQLRRLEAELSGRTSFRWDPLHYEPVVYEVANSLLLGSLCPNTQRWECSE